MLQLIAFFGVLGLASCVSTQAPTAASCPSDCSKKYESAMTACKTAPQDPTGVDTIQSCMDAAQQSYGTCQMNCATID